MITGGSRGLGRIAEAAQALLSALPLARLLVVCGANTVLYDQLRDFGRAQPRLSLFGALDVERMRALMGATDLLVGKAGGVTSAECLALGLPMVVLDPLAGQEQRNARFLTNAGAAVTVGEPSALPRAIESLLRSSGLEGLRAAARALGRPEAAKRAIEAILALA
jgi:processive 1,2-diacylglycerol beta-glucosyltransferase